MRIGIVAPPWLSIPPGKYGGTEVVVDALARGLQELGHEVLLACVDGSTCPVKRVTTIKLDPEAVMGNGTTELTHAIAAYRAFSEAGVDVVHDHTLIGLFVANRFPHLPVVSTVHGPLSSLANRNYAFELADLRDMYTMVSSHVQFIAISHRQAQDGDGLPIASTIHHGLIPDDFRIGDGNGGYVAFLARMARNKGAHRAIEAARIAGVKLRIAARLETYERAYFDAEIAPYLGEDIEFIGEVDLAGKNELLGGAIALLNPITWAEPFGLNMIESLACGTPVIAFANGAAPEIVETGVNGILCDSVSDMAAAITKVDAISREDTRESFDRCFTATRMARDHVATFQEVIAKHPATAR